MAIWSIARPFGIFGGHLVYFMVIWYIFPILVCCMYREKSGNPVQIMPTAKSLWSGAYSTGLTVSHTRQSTQDEEEEIWEEESE
jgi:hypothetical protein